MVAWALDSNKQQLIDAREEVQVLDRTAERSPPPFTTVSSGFIIVIIVIVIVVEQDYIPMPCEGSG